MTAIPTAEPLNIHRHIPTAADIQRYLTVREQIISQKGVALDADVIMFAARSDDAKRFFVCAFVGSSVLFGPVLENFLRAYDQDCGDPEGASVNCFDKMIAHMFADPDRTYTGLVGRTAVCDSWRSFRPLPSGIFPTVEYLYAYNGRDSYGRLTNYYRPPCEN